MTVFKHLYEDPCSTNLFFGVLMLRHQKKRYFPGQAQTSRAKQHAQSEVNKQWLTSSVMLYFGFFDTLNFHLKGNEYRKKNMLQLEATMQSKKKY